MLNSMITKPGLRRQTKLYSKQRGAALIIALIFMAVLTMLGLTVVGSTSDEEKIARNFRDMDIAFAATEAAVRDAEIRITGRYANPATPVSPFDFNSTCSSGLCDESLPKAADTYDFFGSTAPGSNSMTLGGSSSVTQSLTTSPAIQGVAVKPRYLVESICSAIPGESATTITCQTVYRITAKGKGLSGNTAVVLQELFVP